MLHISFSEGTGKANPLLKTGAPMSLYPCTFLKTMQQGEGREGVQKKEREKKGY